ncbi:MAG: hypothetical protein ACFNUF_00580, partial [Tannerella sp.]
KNYFLAVSDGPKWPKTSFWSFLAKRCGSELPLHPPKRWIAAYISLRPYLSGRLLLPPIFQREIYTTDKYDAEN